MKQTIAPATSLFGTIKSLPPDKSIAHRAAMFAALAEGSSKITNFPEAADPQSTLSCLEGLGINIKREGNTLLVTGAGRSGWEVKNQILDCGNSGTTMRLLSGIIAGAGLNVTLTGDDSLKSRPMKRVLDPLKQMGANIECSEGMKAPLKFKSSAGLKPISYVLPMPSAQVKSCVLLAGLFTSGVTEVHEKLPSRDHTERMLGLEKAYLPDGTIIIRSDREHELESFSITIPGDISGAAFWMVAGSIVPNSEIMLKNVGINPTRNAVITILQRMGANIRMIANDDKHDGEPVADIIVKSAQLKATDIKPNEVPNCIDEIPVLAVAMSFAKGTSTVRKAEELRAKETDRIMAIMDIFKKAGVDAKELPDGFEVIGSPVFIPKPAEYESFHDHRIAMSAAVMSLKANKESQINGSEAASISYPDFWNHLLSLYA